MTGRGELAPRLKDSRRASFGERGGLGGAARLPFPEKLSGKLEEWEEWSCSVKSQVALFQSDSVELMDLSDRFDATVADGHVRSLSTDEDARAQMAKFSRPLHYLLTQITSDGARLTARSNVALNGFESWRLLAKRFSLPDTARNISLLTRIWEFRFRTESFEQDYSEWKMLKNR